MKRIVIVGAGFAGLAAARALRHSDAEVFVVDRANHNLFQPLLYQVATTVLSPAQIASPIRGLLQKQRNTTVIRPRRGGFDRLAMAPTHVPLRSVCGSGLPCLPHGPLPHSCSLQSSVSPFQHPPVELLGLGFSCRSFRSWRSRLVVFLFHRFLIELNCRQLTNTRPASCLALAQERWSPLSCTESVRTQLGHKTQCLESETCGNREN